MTGPSLPGALLHPDAFPWQPETVDLVETHISWVFLAGDRVVKLKRPVDLGFVDHTTLERRRHSCEEEVRLNRRLTTGVYLGVVPITDEGGRLAVDGAGTVVDWGTLMRRLPAEAMLDAILKTGEAPADLGDRLADCLVPFHRDGASPAPGAPGDLNAVVTGVVRDNLDELSAFPFAPVELGMVASAMRQFLDEHGDALHARAAAGHVRDGHGDLRCEHVCLEEGGPPHIFDCVEFSPELRWVDVASDLAFLLMDLDRLGAGPAAARLLERYRGSGFDLPGPLLRVYWAHRALVRAKVWCLRDPDGMAFADRALAYVHEAARQVLTVRPALICMSGLSGTGKSAIARAMATALGVPRIASDDLRKDLAGVTGPAENDWRTGIYAPEWTERTYDAMFAAATSHLGAGKGVILDGTFLDGRRREQMAAVARDHGVPFVLVETTCDDHEVRRRLAARRLAGRDPSDAGVAVYDRQRATILAAPPPVPRGTTHIVVDTTASQPAVLEPVLAPLERSGVVVPRIPDRDPVFRTSP